MKIVITGGAGFLGLNIARKLINRNTLIGPSGNLEDIDSILLFDVAIPAERPTGLDSRVEMIAGDISDRETVMNLIDRDDISIFHLASVVSGQGEQDFDLAMSVNLDGGRNILEAARARSGTPRVVFASSVAVFGGSEMPAKVSDFTKQTSQTTYGITKTIGELLINDYTRKGYIDGRSARLPTIFIRPGKPNAAASSFCSGVFREPLNGVPCELPVQKDVVMPMLGYRRCVDSFIALHEIEGRQLGEDRAVGLRNRSYSVADMIDAVERVAAKNDIMLGDISVKPNPAIEAIVRGWATHLESSRAEKIGLPIDDSLDQVVQDFIDDFL
ncbi:MAG: NAD-dependent epimerase/dehydratase family protein [Sneathiella sp.]|nr:NAD-dependent epimerase/dehydratase family protein [Sneathiella sp.]